MWTLIETHSQQGVARRTRNEVQIYESVEEESFLALPKSESNGRYS